MAAQVAVHVARLEHGSAEFVRAEAQHLLRRLLALRLGCAPAEIAVVRGQDGKPRLRGGELEFSVSRRARWCAVALSADCAVGVDLEPVRAFAGMDDVAAAFFPPPARAPRRVLPLVDAPRGRRQGGRLRPRGGGGLPRPRDVPLGLVAEGHRGGGGRAGPRAPHRALARAGGVPRVALRTHG